MTNPFIADIKNQYKNGSALIKLIFINVIVFLSINVIGLLLYFFNIENGIQQIVYWLSLPSDFTKLIYRPWTLLSYMFLHEEIFHLLFNMLVLYFGGQIFLQFLNNKKLVSTYLLGGLSGGVLYIVLFNVLPVFSQLSKLSFALGASASVMAVLIASATYVPNFVVRLIFLGNVKLKYIALVYVVLDMVSIPKGNSGGHIAHLGGALFGFIYITQLQKGRDLTVGFNRSLDSLKGLFSFKRKMKVVYKSPKSRDDHQFNEQKKANQQKIDVILDKISKSGYDSLTGEEKSILFDASKK